MAVLTMEQSRGIMLDVLKEFASFCDAHHLSYYLAYGTMLGAVRHKGFIPWDDDIDVMMPEEDFLRFVSLYSSERYEVVECYKDLSHLLPMGRLYDNYSYSIRSGHRSRGISIDIYLMYDSPNKENTNIKQLYKKYDGIVHRLHFWRRYGRSLSLRHIIPDRWNPFLYIARHYSMKYMKFYQRYPLGKGKHIFVTSDFRFYDSSALDSTVELPFEDGFFCVPAGYDSWLTTRYKNYMELPPLSERKPRHHAADYYID